LIGLPNTGKSFSWTFYEKGEEVYAICPSSKIVHIRDSSKKLIQPIQISIDGVGNNISELCIKLAQPNANSLVRKLNGMYSGNKKVKGTSELEVKTTGNIIQCSDVKYVADWKLFISNFTDAKVILTTDFTHYVSSIIGSKEFMARKSGGEAFSRFWDLAADMLNNILLSTDQLRHGLIDVTEFHAQYDKDLNLFKIFLPAGNMLNNSFLPESYFDVMLHSTVLPYEQEPDESKRFKFVVVQKEQYSGRSMNLFESKDGTIPNNMQLVINKLQDYLK
jgi:hypothetical protein